MSISISPSVIVGMIGRSVPDARRAITMHRASSSSGENGHGQDVVHAEVERRELRLQVAAPGQTEDRRHDVAGKRVRSPETLQQRRAVIVVHVDDADVRLPAVEDRLGLRQVMRGSDDE